jgi:hypothetical protein
MESLHKMTPEQLKALSPECLQLLINSDNMNNDIAKLKYYFTSLTYTTGNIKTAKYNESEARIAREILIKYSNQQFYLTFEYKNISVDVGSIFNWKLHTNDEIKLLIPTGANINKIICSNESNKTGVICREGFDDKVTHVRHIPDLPFFHSNLYIINPKLLNVAYYFFDDDRFKELDY